MERVTPKHSIARSLDRHFADVRSGIIGIETSFDSPYGAQRIVYADWTASGRLYEPIERRISATIGPFVANTHSESSITGTTMTHAYHSAHERIKRHVNAGPHDVIVTAGFGMTAVVNKFQRILGLRLPEQLRRRVSIDPRERPVVFVTHMEHHSNHTSWLETIADVVVIDPDPSGLVNPDHLHDLLERYRERPLKIGSFTACSNVTGIRTPYHRLAAIMHEHGGYCFVDFAASAPYDPIDMHPDNPSEKLDAVFFSPHKFLGGPGSSGVLVFDSNLYRIEVPDHPGGGTVDWTNPWGGHRFVDDIEAREDGGTPGFLQAIRAALAIELKERMGSGAMARREGELVQLLFGELGRIPGVHLLAPQAEERLGIISFYVETIHYNLIVKLLNDRFGIQTRGGCSCAGTYGHYLLHVDPTRSRQITDRINRGDLSEKPGWVRISIHPTTTDEEAGFIADAVRRVVENAVDWERDYTYSAATNEFINRRGEHRPNVEEWLRFPG